MRTDFEEQALDPEVQTRKPEFRARREAGRRNEEGIKP